MITNSGFFTHSPILRSVSPQKKKKKEEREKEKNGKKPFSGDVYFCLKTSVIKGVTILVDI